MYRGPKHQQLKMASVYHVGAAVLAHVARRGQLDSALDERSWLHLKGICVHIAATLQATWVLLYWPT